MLKPNLRYPFAVLGLGAALVASPDAAAAQTPLCGPRGPVIEQLGRTYDELPVSRGVSADGALVELLVSPSGSWTLLVSRPDGRACLAATGEAWHPPVAVADRPAPSAPAALNPVP